MQLVLGALKPAGLDLQVPKFDLPLDVRSIYAQGLEPTITQAPCCPTCYKSYSVQSMPTACTYRRSQRARPCGAALWTFRRTRNGHKQIPKCYYRTQSFESWLQSLLAWQVIEDHLEQSFLRNQNAPTGLMHDIQDSPASQSLRDYLQTCYHLVFSFYIDWFNPFTNKIAGMFELSFFLQHLTFFRRQGSFIWGNDSLLPQPTYRDSVPAREYFYSFTDTWSSKYLDYLSHSAAVRQHYEPVCRSWKGTCNTS